MHAPKERAAVIIIICHQILIFTTPLFQVRITVSVIAASVALPDMTPEQA